jgi:hypothetical protein
MRDTAQFLIQSEGLGTISFVSYFQGEILTKQFYKPDVEIRGPTLSPEENEKMRTIY